MPIDDIPASANRELKLSLIALAARLRSQGAGRAELREALADHLAGLGAPLFDPATVEGIVIHISTIPSHLVSSAIHELLAGERPPASAPSPLTDAAMDAAQSMGLEERSGLPVHTAATIARDTPQAVEWVAEPWAAAGALTAITGRPKIGKTTFALDLVAAVLDGRPFLNYPASASPHHLPSPLEGKGLGMRAEALPRPELGEGRGEGQAQGVRSVVYLTEQQPSSFRASLGRAGLLGRQELAVIFWHQAMALSWPRVVLAATRACRARSARLLVVDTLSQWAGMRGDMENQAGDAFAALQPLQQLAATGVAVIFLQHERKSGGDAADSGRGSSAFAGAVDTLISFRRPGFHTVPHAQSLPSPLEGEGPGMRGKSNGPGARSALRLLLALSRFETVPPELYIERTEGRYYVVGDAPDFATERGRAAVLAALSSGMPPSPLEGEGPGMRGGSPSLDAATGAAQTEGQGVRSVSPSSDAATEAAQPEAPGDTSQALTLDTLMKATGVSRPVVTRAVNALFAAGQIRRAGTGRRGDPYRYWTSDSFLFAIE